MNITAKLVMWAYAFFPITFSFEFTDGILSVYKEPEGAYQTASSAIYYQEPDGWGRMSDKKVRSPASSKSRSKG